MPHSPAFENSDTQYEREEQLVLLEQRSTDVAVDAAGEVKIQNLAAFRQIVALLADDDRLSTTTVDDISLLCRMQITAGADLKIDV